MKPLPPSELVILQHKAGRPHFTENYRHIRNQVLAFAGRVNLALDLVTIDQYLAGSRTNFLRVAKKGGEVVGLIKYQKERTAYHITDLCILPGYSDEVSSTIIRSLVEGVRDSLISQYKSQKEIYIDMQGLSEKVQNILANFGFHLDENNPPQHMTYKETSVEHSFSPRVSSAPRPRER